MSHISARNTLVFSVSLIFVSPIFVSHTLVSPIPVSHI